MIRLSPRTVETRCARILQIVAAMGLMSTDTLATPFQAQPGASDGAATSAPGAPEEGRREGTAGAPDGKPGLDPGLDNADIPKLESAFAASATREDARALASAYLANGQSSDALAIATGQLGSTAGAEDHLLVARASLAEADRRSAGGESSSFLASLFADAEHQSRLATADPKIGDEAAAFLAFVLFRLNRSSESLDELDRLLTRTPSHAEGRALRGYLRLQMGDADAAREDLSVAIAAEPERTDIRVHYARALAAKSPADAVRALRAVIDQGLADASFAKDVYEVLAARTDLAVQTLTQLARARSDDPNAWYWLGRAQSDATLHAAADDSYTRALELAPGDPVVLAYRAFARGNIEDITGMVEDLIAVAGTDIAIPERDWCVRRLQATALWHVQQGAWSEVARLSRELRAAIPDDPSAHGNLAIALMRIGSVEEAEQIFTDAIEWFPANERLQNDLGILLEGVGRTDEAKDHFQQASGLGSLDGKENLALLLIAEDESKAARPKGASDVPRSEKPTSPHRARAEALLREVLAIAPARVRSLSALERLLIRSR